ncbi:MAG: DmsE family decaheme c-type cytochrome [Vicinamibacterales bacterium]
MRRSLLVLTFAVGWVLAGSSVASAQPAAATWTAKDCQVCHEQAATGPSFIHTKHAALESSCATCHSNVSEHYKAKVDGVDGPSPSLKKAKASEVNRTCLTCHEKAKQASFLSSMHARRGVACISCHSVHDSKSKRALLKTANDAETCYSCHKAYRVKMQRTSHHPVREGKMSCSSCHNPHEGTTPKMLSANSVNEKCYQCHTEKRGPFLHEHAPVRTNCVTCHEPHGSNHDKLLNASMPYLCQRCHFSGGHPGNLYDLSNTLKGSPVPVPGGTVISARSVDRDCKNCHSQLHGSNALSGTVFGR